MGELNSAIAPVEGLGPVCEFESWMAGRREVTRGDEEEEEEEEGRGREVVMVASALVVAAVAAVATEDGEDMKVPESAVPAGGRREGSGAASRAGWDTIISIYKTLSNVYLYYLYQSH